MRELWLYLGFGLITGAVISIAALGLSLLFGTIRYINFAFGDTLALGAYVALAANLAGLPLWLSTLAAMAVTGLAGVAIHWVVIRPLQERARASPLALLIATVGVAFILRNLILVLWGPDPQKYILPFSRASRIGPFLLTGRQLVALALAAVVMLGMWVFLRYTPLGRAMRAVSDNPQLARLRGIDTDRVIAWAWFVSSALAALAGVVLGSMGSVDPNMGLRYLLAVFAAVILGGIGNPYGAVAGAMIIGAAMETSAALGVSSYKPAFAYVLLFLMLLLRPRGLFGLAT